MNKLFLVRHAESEGNVNPKVYYEKHDSKIAITPKGHEQAAVCAELLYEKIQKDRAVTILTSPYLRTLETSKYISNKFLEEGRDVKIIENVFLREREWGELRVIVDNRQFIKNKHFDFYYRPENGESYADTYNRVALFFFKLRMIRMECDVLLDRDLVIVSHGEWIRLALMYLDTTSVGEFTENDKAILNCCIIERNL
jgi:broad specificity phosphatase PhoE